MKFLTEIKVRKLRVIAITLLTFFVPNFVYAGSPSESELCRLRCIRNGGQNEACASECGVPTYTVPDRVCEGQRPATQSCPSGRVRIELDKNFTTFRLEMLSDSYCNKSYSGQVSNGALLARTWVNNSIHESLSPARKIGQLQSVGANLNLVDPSTQKSILLQCYR